MDDQVKRETLAAFLYQGFADWQQEQYEKEKARWVKSGRKGAQPRLKSQTHFAINVLGVNQASFSQWASGMRIPDAESKARLVEFYGPKLYRILDEPEMLPKSMSPLAELWPDLTSDERKLLIAMAEEKAAKHKKEVPNASTQTQVG